jgi:hypothetical protein
VFLSLYTYALIGRDSSIGLAIRYGLNGPVIESRWVRGFPHPSRPALGPSQPPIQWYRVYPGGKVAGAWCWAPTPSSAEAKERVELYFLSPFGLSLPVLGWTLYLPSLMYWSRKCPPVKYGLTYSINRLHVPVVLQPPLSCCYRNINKAYILSVCLHS